MVCSNSKCLIVALNSSSRRFLQPSEHALWNCDRVLYTRRGDSCSIYWKSSDVFPVPHHVCRPTVSDPLWHLFCILMNWADTSTFGRMASDINGQQSSLRLNTSMLSWTGHKVSSTTMNTFQIKSVRLSMSSNSMYSSDNRRTVPQDLPRHCEDDLPTTVQGVCALVQQSFWSDLCFGYRRYERVLGCTKHGVTSSLAHLNTSYRHFFLFVHEASCWNLSRYYLTHDLISLNLWTRKSWLLWTSWMTLSSRKINRGRIISWIL